ncbi:free fatty acid receptor 2 [Amia ocellicauda]|uniref:free fatty acid receptor 2 n=1 Tax=Amia ocellicauda TaxID=2972642 RepID=UPI003464AC9C
MEKYAHSQVVLAIYIITFITGLPSNILAFYTFSKRVRTKQTPIDILLLNLTVSDLIFLIFLPFRMNEAYFNMEWHLPYLFCPLSGFVFYSTIYISTFFLTAVSVERYLGVAYPIKYKINRKPKYAIIASVFFWVVSTAHCSIVYIIQYNNKNNQTVCYENFTDEQKKILLPVRLELCLVLFCIPFAISTFCYVNFIRILSKLPNISHRRRKRAIGLALGTLVVFILCFGPYNISHVVGFIQNKSPEWRVDALLPSTFNACLDPIIFYFSSSAVQKTFSHCLSAVLSKLCVINPRSKYCPLTCSNTEESEGSSNTVQ